MEEWETVAAFPTAKETGERANINKYVIVAFSKRRADAATGSNYIVQ